MGLRNGTHVPKVGFAAAKWGLGCEMEVWEPWVISQRISQLRNRGMGCEMTLMCQGDVSHGVAMGLRNGFAEKGPFRSEPLISQRAPCGCEIILQRMAIFAGCYFGL